MSDNPNYNNLTSTFAVGRYICMVSIKADVAVGGTQACHVEWAPERPTRLSAEECFAYRRGRDAVLAKLARLIGGNVAIVEA